MKEYQEKGFRICNNKGFHIGFDNGWVVSVQFGDGNYCDNHDNMEHDGKPKESTTAEVWAWNQKGNYPNDPLAYQTPDQVAKFINKIKNRKKV